MKFDIIDIPATKASFGSRNGAPINSIIVHSVGLKLKEVFKVFKESSVCPHYLVPQVSAAELIKILPDIFKELGINYQEPTLSYPNQVPVIRLVADEYKAFHSGVSNFAKFNSHPECSKGLNAVSLGIEFHNPEYAKRGDDWYHFSSFTQAQKAIGIELISHLVDQYTIPKQNILAHSTIAVGRKTDPGPLFFWEDLYKSGLCYLPKAHERGEVFENPSMELVIRVQNLLKNIGFNNCLDDGVVNDNFQQHVDAYIMQFVPNLWEGKFTPLSEGILHSLEGFDKTTYM